jgi:hypothetical protein
LESAVAVRTERVAAVLEGERQEHLRITPTRDEDGDVVIVLSDGKHKSKGDEEFWHELTFKRKWCLHNAGYSASLRSMLHTAVMRLIDSDYVSGRNSTVDHIDQTAKLDN